MTPLLLNFLVFGFGMLTVAALWGMVNILVHNDALWKYSVVTAMFLIGVGAIAVFIPEMSYYTPLARSGGTCLMCVGAYISVYRRTTGAESTPLKQSSIRAIGLVMMVAVILTPFLGMYSSQHKTDTVTLEILGDMKRQVEQQTGIIISLARRITRIEDREQRKALADSLFQVRNLANQKRALSNQADVKSALARTQRHTTRPERVSRPVPVYPDLLQSKSTITPIIDPARVKPVPAPAAPVRSRRPGKNQTSYVDTLRRDSSEVVRR